MTKLLSIWIDILDWIGDAMTAALDRIAESRARALATWKKHRQAETA